MAKENVGQAQATEQQGKEDDGFVRIKFPPGFAHYYEHTDPNGNKWDKAILNIPPGTKMNGVDLTGFSVDVFVADWQIPIIANGESLTVGFKKDEKIQVFRSEYPEKGISAAEMELDPWALSSAVKAQRAQYAADMAQNREAVQESPVKESAKEAGPASLSDRAAAAKDVSAHQVENEAPAHEPVVR